MEDSFFGFETSLPDDDGGGGIGGIDLEGEYDALNDETFGEASKGDWEDLHENLVRLTTAQSLEQSFSSTLKDNDHDDSDLDINLVRVNLDDFDISNDDTESRVQLDPSVWAVADKSILHDRNGSQDNFSLYNNNHESFLRQHFAHPFSNTPQSSNPMSGMPAESSARIMSPAPSQPGPPKMLSLEDLERNILNQQQQQKKPLQENKASIENQISNFKQSLSKPKPFQIQPPVMPNARPQMFLPPPHQLMNYPNSGGRLPPGFPPTHHHMQHSVGNGSNNNGPQNQQLPQPPQPQNHLGPKNIQPNLPTPHNNFNMHPAFILMRPQLGSPLGIPPQRMPNLGPPIPPALHQMQQQQQQQQQQFQQNVPTNSAQYNKRLLQEIQQTHPMLSYNRNGMNNNFNHHNNLHHNYHNNNNHHHHQNHHNNNNNNNNNSNNNNNNMNGGHKQQQLNNRSNGNLNLGEYDEYSNLMSARDKQWLIGIQLMQLNTETPYVDDYYFCVYKERKTKLKGERESKAHKNNTMNHPFTQPKGHAQMLLMSSLGNRNGLHQKNGLINNRERRNSENTKFDNKELSQQSPRQYIPLQFENSLGKLQYGSVTAPRKIIDMDIVGVESNSPFSASNEISAQRKSRQILLHIETLYKVVLKLEDLKNPTAIAAALIIKEKVDKERQIALDQAQQDTDEVKSVSIINSRTSSISLNDKNDEPETEMDLLPKLIAALTPEKVMAMMNVRKGKTLLKRIMPLIKEQSIRWVVWCAIFTALPIILKKDKDDVDGVLIALYSEFEKHLHCAEFSDVVKIASVIYNKLDKYLFECKFSISSIISLILHAETIYSTMIEIEFVSNTDKENWVNFLKMVCVALTTTPQAHIVIKDLANENLLPIVKKHFSRFDELGVLNIF